MRVLILDYDLFATVGGGQTFYRNAILRNPNIEFFYLRQSESLDAPRPCNAFPIDFKCKFSRTSLLHFCDITVPNWTHPLYQEANNIAFSVAGQTFDIVDYPDYRPIGVFLKEAFGSQGVRAGKIAISMHGTMSTTNALNWEGNGRVCHTTRSIEDLQYAVADIRYFISERYRQEWNSTCTLPSHHVDPLNLFPFPGRHPFIPSKTPPSLNFIGRTEKRKGPHVFLELIWWLPPSSFSKATIIGPACTGPDQMSSTDRLHQFCRNRELEVHFLEALSTSELLRLFSSNSVTFAPSLYDTFNLVALESIFSGCPTVIGSGAGIIDYLRGRFPKIPFETIELKSFYSCIPSIEKLLTNYDQYRAWLAQALEESDYTAQGPTLAEVYQSQPYFDDNLRIRLKDWYSRLTKALPKALN